MPKNVKGGSKHKKMKNTSNSDEITHEHLILKQGNDQDYGKVEKLLGNCRVTLLCNDKINRIGIIRGSMRKRQWLNVGNIVIYSVRPYEKDKVDIIHVYNNNVLKMLETRMNLSFNINGEEDNIDDIFTLNEEDTYIIPDKQKVKNTYYNFSDSEEEKESKTDVLIDDDFINDI
jgi:translation initiation factor 1A